MSTSPVLPTDPTAQVEEAETAAVAAVHDVRPHYVDHFADYIPRSQWQRATWLNTPDPLLIVVLIDAAVGLVMMGFGGAAIAGITASPVVTVLYLITVASTLAGAIARAWSYSYRVWPKMHRLAHPHALPAIDGGRVRKTWIPGQRRCRAYLDGRLPD